MTTTISPLPTPPTPADSPVDFNTKAFALLGGLPTFVAEANAQAAGVDASVAAAGAQAAIATNKAGEALTSANNAALSKTGADSARDAAVIAKNAAEAALDSFDDRYLGQKSSNPTADNDGGALLVGALYFRTTAPIGMKVWTGTAWDDAYANLSSKLDKTGGDVSGSISVAGNVLATSGALGYGVGAGGTVTQATSKSTAVTLNKPTGQVTMNNEALGAGIAVFFQLNNSLISGTDTVQVATFGGGASYLANCVSVSAGAALIRVVNNTAGSLSDSVILNFAIIKGATS